MAINYFKSEDIRVYPTAHRGTFSSGTKTFVHDPEARLSTEFNLTNNFHKTVERQSYIVDYIPDGSTSAMLKCVVGGYYFEINNFNTYLGDKPQYLVIKTKDVSLINEGSEARKTLLLCSLESNATETTALDSEGNFTGLGFTNSASESGSYDSLQLFLDKNCTQLNQDAYLLTSLIRLGTGYHAIVGTYNFESTSNILSPNDTTKVNVGSGDYSITFGQANTNRGKYNLIYGSNNIALASGSQNIILLNNTAKRTTEGSNNILIGKDIVGTGNQLILNQIKDIKISNGENNTLSYTPASGLKIGENFLQINDKGNFVLNANYTASASENTPLLNITNKGTDQLTLRSIADGKTQLAINGNIMADNLTISNSISGPIKLTMGANGLIDNSNGTIKAKTIINKDSSNNLGTATLGTVDAASVTVTGALKANSITSSTSIAGASLSISQQASVGNLAVTSPATGISFGNGAVMRYNSSNKRFEIIC